MASPSYQLTREAAEDLRSIALYTIEKWGIDQAKLYEAQLKACLEQIASGEAIPRNPIPHRPEILHARCQHHHLFYTRTPEQLPLIIAILHERMDLIARLESRLT